MGRASNAEITGRNRSSIIAISMKVYISLHINMKVYIYGSGLHIDRIKHWRGRHAFMELLPMKRNSMSHQDVFKNCFTVKYIFTSEGTSKLLTNFRNVEQDVLMSKLFPKQV